MSKRKWLLAAGLVAVFAAVGLGYQGISLFLEAQYWETKMGHGEGKLRVGDMAPDFELQYKKSEEPSGCPRFAGKNLFSNPKMSLKK